MDTGINNSASLVTSDRFPAKCHRSAAHSLTQFAASRWNRNACLCKRLLPFLLGFVLHIAVLAPVDNFSSPSLTFPQALISECAFFFPLFLMNIFRISEHWIRFFALESGICSAFLWLAQFSVDGMQTAVFTTLLRAVALLTVDASRAGRTNVIHRLRSFFWLIVLCLLGASLKYAAMR